MPERSHSLLASPIVLVAASLATGGLAGASPLDKQGIGTPPDLGRRERGVIGVG